MKAIVIKIMPHLFELLAHHQDVKSKKDCDLLIKKCDYLCTLIEHVLNQNKKGTSASLHIRIRFNLNDAQFNNFDFNYLDLENVSSLTWMKIETSPASSTLIPKSFFQSKKKEKQNTKKSEPVTCSFQINGGSNIYQVSYYSQSQISPAYQSKIDASEVGTFSVYTKILSYMEEKEGSYYFYKNWAMVFDNNKFNNQLDFSDDFLLKLDVNDFNKLLMAFAKSVAGKPDKNGNLENFIARLESKNEHTKEEYLNLNAQTVIRKKCEKYIKLYEKIMEYKTNDPNFSCSYQSDLLTEQVNAVQLSALSFRTRSGSI